MIYSQSVEALSCLAVRMDGFEKGLAVSEFFSE